MKTGRAFSCDSLFCLLAVNAWLRLVPVKLPGIRLGRGSWFKSRFSIGHGSGIGTGFTLRGSGKLVMGRYCAVGEGVRIITSNHDMDRLSMNYLIQDQLAGQRFMADKRDVVIGNDVWVGDEAILLPGIVVGDGAVIGAGAVVTKSVDAYTVVGGNPAKMIKARFTPEIRAQLEKLAWWNWSESELRQNARLFSLKVTRHPHDFRGRLRD